MRKFEKNIDNRKLLVGRLSELTRLESRYTFVPRCAYVVGSFTVEKDGTLTVEDGADEQVLSTLISEGMIGAELEIAAPAWPAEALEAPARVTARSTATVDKRMLLHINSMAKLIFLLRVPFFIVYPFLFIALYPNPRTDSMENSSQPSNRLRRRPT